MSEHRVPVAVVGATGMVGQCIVDLLRDHPWFEVSEVVASDNNVGVRYRDAVIRSPADNPRGSIDDQRLQSLSHPLRSPIVFSAMPADVACEHEQRLAEQGHLVFSNASAHRMLPAVPLIIPEVNAPSISVVKEQAFFGQGGGIVTNPNCVVAGLALALAPIHQAFGLENATVVTMQAISGAGLRAVRGQYSHNIVPFIKGEEEKIPGETNKILGTSCRFSVSVNRVSVRNGHTVSVFVNTGDRVTVRHAMRVLRAFDAIHQVPKLPSAPTKPLYVCANPDEPQPKRDVDRDGGMTVSVGQLREDTNFDLKFTLLVNNLIRGAAGACVLNAELLLAAAEQGLGLRKCHFRSVFRHRAGPFLPLKRIC